MRRVLPILLAFLVSVCVSTAATRIIQGTARHVPAVASGGFYYPTNIPGFTAYTWHVADDYTTNSGMATLPERLGTSLDLTNTAGGASPVGVANNLNGHRTLTFDGGLNTLLRSLPWNGGAQPLSFHLVIAWTNAGSTIGGVMCSTNSSGNNYFARRTDNGQAQVRASSGSVNPGYLQTNKWQSVAVVINGTSTQVWTNGAQLGSNVNPGSDSWVGLDLGRLANSTGFDGNFAFVEMATYKAALDAAAISNLFVGATNVYAFTY